MTILGIIFWVVVIVASYAHENRAFAARQRIGTDRCTRCGQRSPEAPSEMCPSCRRLTQRTYRMATWFFYLLALMFIIIVPGEMVTDYRAFGAKAVLQDALLFALVITLTLGAGFAIQHFGRKEG